MTASDDWTQLRGKRRELVTRERKSGVMARPVELKFMG
jgi:hypothetical protein